MLDLKIIAPVSSLSNRTRLYKIVKYCFENRTDIKISHIGWERKTGEREEKYLKDIHIKKTIILKGGGYGGIITRLMYFFWMMFVFFYCLFGVSKKSTVWALGFESAFPALIASKIKGFKIIFDDADRFSMLFNFPKRIARILESLEKYTSYNVACHVVPGTSRYDFHSESMFTLKNLPSKNVIEESKAIYSKSLTEWPDAKIVIYVNGWLGSSRGMRAALDISNYFSGNDVSFILAGKLDCSDAKALSKKEQVLYLGSVSNEDALCAYYASDFVMTYYDPVSKVNRHAESNKWGDAIVTNTAVLVNSEIETAKWLQEYGIAISTPYNDSGKLIDNLRRIINNKLELESLKNNISRYSYENPIFFEEGLEKVFSKVN